MLPVSRQAGPVGQGAGGVGGRMGSQGHRPQLGNLGGPPTPGREVKLGWVLGFFGGGGVMGIFIVLFKTAAC